LNPKFLYSDKRLITDLKNGDKKAFEAIFSRYKNRIYYFALKYLHSAVEAEELVQNTYISLWEHRHLLNEQLPVKSYLFKIAVNSVYNYYKHEAIRKKYLDRLLYSYPDMENTTQNSVEESELHKMIDTLMENLPLKQRLVFNMSRWEGLSHTEIAKRLNLSLRTVENQIYRALKYIKENLSEEYRIWNS